MGRVSELDLEVREVVREWFREKLAESETAFIAAGRVLAKLGQLRGVDIIDVVKDELASIVRMADGADE